MRKVLVHMRIHWGKEMFYAVSPDAIALSKLMRKKSFTKADLRALTKLGFTVELHAVWEAEGEPLNEPEMEAFPAVKPEKGS